MLLFHKSLFGDISEVGEKNFLTLWLLVRNPTIHWVTACWQVLSVSINRDSLMQQNLRHHRAAFYSSGPWTAPFPRQSPKFCEGHWEQMVACTLCSQRLACSWWDRSWWRSKHIHTRTAECLEGYKWKTSWMGHRYLDTGIVSRDLFEPQPPYCPYRVLWIR